ncbi:hypothetical protein NDU88_012570 [Pleurodeles waltl]|uniref:Uncharacterized protein n=1 Tax=Pleurodeles waltl TaxID=8319 RepID=A0AAV7R0I6_PLEWA|nr:hypothetical protein NDU88_012570 [Pleurodeles waltl]
MGLGLARQHSSTQYFQLVKNQSVQLPGPIGPPEVRLAWVAANDQKDTVSVLGCRWAHRSEPQSPCVNLAEVYSRNCSPPQATPIRQATLEGKLQLRLSVNLMGPSTSLDPSAGPTT